MVALGTLFLLSRVSFLCCRGVLSFSHHHCISPISRIRILGAIMEKGSEASLAAMALPIASSHVEDKLSPFSRLTWSTVVIPPAHQLPHGISTQTLSSFGVSVLSFVSSSFRVLLLLAPCYLPPRLGRIFLVSTCPIGHQTANFWAESLLSFKGHDC